MFIANLFLFLVVIIVVIVLRGAINHHIALQELRRKNVNCVIENVCRMVAIYF